ncbi:hypothetical protein Acr_26g0010090 [Actinidia rufa]|uniref:Uncharacterized protein n=1 Tax=Actinidia rufa TaxID=165716 RepID=A0A7J0H3W3_9ERIC|nr:hypothetical protein Acr_26g0010090 [Actinidia rufa]
MTATASPSLIPATPTCHPVPSSLSLPPILLPPHPNLEKCKGLGGEWDQREREGSEEEGYRGVATSKGDGKGGERSWHGIEARGEPPLDPSQEVLVVVGEGVRWCRQASGYVYGEVEDGIVGA